LRKNATVIIGVWSYGACWTVRSEGIERKERIIAVASMKSIGSFVDVGTDRLLVVGIEEALSQKLNVCIFSGGSGVSREFAPQFVVKGK